MDNDLVKHLAWSGLLPGLGALTSIVAQHLATVSWVRVTGEGPPDM